MALVDTRWLIPIPADVETERLQGAQEGKDISRFLNDFARLERSDPVPPAAFFRLCDEVQRWPSATADDEPNDLQSIFYRCPGALPLDLQPNDLENRIRGAWRGKVAGCMLGKPIHNRWNEVRQHDWCHAVSNAEVVTWALLHGGGEFERSVCMVVEAGFDTDCNGATVESVLGAMLGPQSLDSTCARRRRFVLCVRVLGAFQKLPRTSSWDAR